MSTFLIYSYWDCCYNIIAYCFKSSAFIEIYTNYVNLVIALCFCCFFFFFVLFFVIMMYMHICLDSERSQYSYSSCHY